ncbi:MAG: hypothetical protein ACLRWQ_19690 [Flavonifractor plautii]
MTASSARWRRSAKGGAYHLPRGVQVPAADPENEWDFTPRGQPGDAVVGGDVIGHGAGDAAWCSHKIMVPPTMCRAR